MITGSPTTNKRKPNTGVQTSESRSKGRVTDVMLRPADGMGFGHVIYTRSGLLAFRFALIMFVRFGKDPPHYWPAERQHQANSAFSHAFPLGQSHYSLASLSQLLKSPQRVQAENRNLARDFTLTIIRKLFALP